MLQAGCALNYPNEKVDAELFLPLIEGFQEIPESGDFDYTRNVHAFRISKALEHQYIATMLEDTESVHSCALGKEAETRGVTIRITKILEPFDWRPFEESRGIFADARGGILFGWGVRLSDASLLTLRYLLSPYDDPPMTWTSPPSKEDAAEQESLSVEIPYRYIEFEEIALSDKTLGLFEEPMVIYRNQTGPYRPAGCPYTDYDDSERCDPECRVCDNVEIVIDTDSVHSLSGTGKPERLPLSAYRRIELSFRDAPNLTPIRYQFPERKAEGWIDVINLSHFPEGQSYMHIVGALMLAQAGDCDAAFTVYVEGIKPAEKLDAASKAQVLALIGFLHGRDKGDISAVIAELEGLVDNPENVLVDRSKISQLLADYKALNEANRPATVSRATHP
jgi:hypothetical protein